MSNNLVKTFKKEFCYAALDALVHERYVLRNVVAERYVRHKRKKHTRHHKAFPFLLRYAEQRRGEKFLGKGKRHSFVCTAFKCCISYCSVHHITTASCTLHPPPHHPPLLATHPPPPSTFHLTPHSAPEPLYIVGERGSAGN